MGSLPLDVASYIYLYILLMSFLSFIFSLFLIAIWGGESRMFASLMVFSERIRTPSYEELLLEFARKISSSLESTAKPRQRSTI